MRQRIIECLEGGPVPIGMLSQEIGLSERQLRDQLSSLRKQVSLAITPARCGGCGFEFKDRRRIGKPGKCPRCRSTHIHEPLYSIAGARSASAVAGPSGIP